MPSAVAVHRFRASLFPVNAYLVETRDAMVAVDATLGVSDGRRMGALIKAIGKPLAAVVVTHSHPDHYGGISPLLNGESAPVYAVPGVDRVIRRDDALKEEILRPMFGVEWPATRTFPNQSVEDGERIILGGGAVFRVIDAGPSESPHDSWWALDGDGPPRVFVGDLVYNRMHAYVADGHYEDWLANIARAKREFPEDAVFLMGHGQPASGHALLDRQAEYINRLVEAVVFAIRRDGLEGDALVAAVTRRMRAFLPTEDLLFLMQLSIEPLRHQLLGVLT